MKIPYLSCLALTICTVFAPLPAVVAQTIRQPVKPAALLATLPVAPQGWTLKLSRAQHQKITPPKTIATRMYEFTSPPNEAGVSITRKVTIAVKDTLEDPDETQLFIEAAAAAENGRPEQGEWLQIGQERALRSKVSGQVDHVDMLVQRRFMVTFVLTSNAPLGQTAEIDKPENWLKLINYAQLRALGAAASSPLNIKEDFTFNIEVADELRPKNNRTSPMEFGGVAPTAKAEAGL